MTLSDDLLRLTGLFTPVGLEQLEGAELMDRRESKFTASADIVPALLSALAGEYRVLVVGGTALQPYTSRYFDTPEFGFFHDQYVRRSRRHKVRWRHYGSTGASFLEIKQRGGSATQKVRIPLATPDELQSCHSRQFLEEHGIDARDLRPAVDVHCKRITLVRTHPVPERVTLDLGLCLTGTTGHEQCFPGAVIIELKSAAAPQHTHFAPVAARFGLRADQVSKYSVAVALHHPQVKSNLIRPQLRLLQRAQNQAGVR